MRFIDEEYLWYPDVEILAEKLANKSERDVFELLNKYDVIRLDTTKRPKTTLIGRVCFLFLMPVLLTLSAIKWIKTGDRYLDSWVKKLHLERVLKFCGIVKNDD